MDIGKIFECLNEDYRTIVVSISVGFPIAYIDCWKLSPFFKLCDIFPQIMLSLGISVLFVFIGVFFMTLVCLISDNFNPKYIEYNVIGIIFNFAFTSIIAVSGLISSIFEFFCVYLCFFSFFLIACWLGRPSS